MTTEISTPQSKNFVTRMLPWLLCAVMLVVFLSTLDHWVNPNNLGEVSDVCGWTRGPHVLGPLAYLVTSPLRLLPASKVPLALNIFTALCAALTLGQLARSVALLPHDRTHEQRQREQNEFSFLTITSAWVPPLFAVLACGLQMTFWENAINATGEMFDLLIFAFVIRCLIEFRILQKDGWLFIFAIVYGLGMAENWALVGFFPLFLAAVIWMKGLALADSRFLLRFFACGLAGLLLFFLFPLMRSLHHDAHAGFWMVLRSTLVSEKTILLHFPREVALLLGLTSILPVFVISLRWASYFGDNSPVGIFIATSMFHIIHALFFIACIWVALDAPISPRLKGYGVSFLTYYYLGALCIGYFSGYFLLIFGPRSTKSRNSMNPLLQLVNWVVTACVWILLLAVPLILVRKNLPFIQSTKNVYSQYDKYFEKIQQALPSKGAVVLCDEPADPYSFRLQYLEAMLHRNGHPAPVALVSAKTLSHDPDYLAFLQKRYPDFHFPAAWKHLIGEDPSPMEIIHELDLLSKDHPLYYLHPSFGDFFEQFYAEPQGIVFQLKPYPKNTWDAPLPTPALIASNDIYWKDTFTNVLPPLLEIYQRPEPSGHSGYWEILMTKLHLKPELDRLAVPLGALYSRTLDNWGVELERSGHLTEAGKVFDQAGLLNPFNVSAGINKAFNEKLIANKEILVRPPKDLEEKLGRHRTWTDVLTSDGPIDEPNCRDDLAVALANALDLRQCVQHLNRIKEVAPLDDRVPLQLAQLMLYIQGSRPGLSLLMPYEQGFSIAYTNTEEVLRRAPDEPTALFLNGVSLIQLKDYKRAIEPLTRLLSLQPTNYAALLDRAIAYYKVDDLAAAKQDYDVVHDAMPTAYQASYGLGEIAYKQNDKLAAIKNYEFYLSNAPTNTPEANGVITRLKELKSGAPAP